jgi:hypothetical protein
MMRVVTSRLLLLAAALAAMASTAIAQPSDGDRAEAARLAKEGQKHGSKNELGKALEKFRAASRLDPSTPTYLCNVGMAYYGLAELARAHLNLARCRAALGSWPDGVSEVYAFVEKELVRRKFGRVRIEGEPARASISILAYEEEGELAAPLEVYLGDGNYVFVVSAPGYQPYTGELRVVGGVAQKPVYGFQLQAVVAATTPAGTSDAAVAAPGGAPRTPGGTSRRRLFGWTGVAAGGAAMIGGGVAFLLAVQKLDDINALNEPGGEDLYATDDRLTPEGQALVDSMQRRELTAWVLGGVGASLAGAGLYLLLTDDGDRGEGGAPMVSAGVAPDGGMVSLRWAR